MTRINYILNIFLVALIAHSIDASAQTCGAESSPQESNTRFFINADDTVTDLDSGLTWMRCSVGMEWNGKHCIGAARTFDWRIAMQLGKKNPPGSHAWRLPRLPELATLVEQRCKIAPRVNTTIFPDTPAKPHWTSTTKPGWSDTAYALGFDARGVAAYAHDQKFAVRLVTGRED
ncbi:MAG: DUF1566 domain-containing protein [Pseudomonadota bacterium]